VTFTKPTDWLVKVSSFLIFMTLRLSLTTAIHLNLQPV